MIISHYYYELATDIKYIDTNNSRSSLSHKPTLNVNVCALTDSVGHK